jgi:transposase InsO family protein
MGYLGTQVSPSRLWCIGADATRLTAKHYGLTVSGKLEPCTHCGMAKARQTNLAKSTDVRSQIKGERLFIDLSWTLQPSYGGTKYWLLVMDDLTGYVWSFFLKTKDEVAETVLALRRRRLQHQKITVKYIRCDNAGEHLTLQDRCNEEGLGITFEFTSRNTPQHNGRIERKFQTLYGRVKSMLNYHSGIPLGRMRKGLWTEAKWSAAGGNNNANR